MGSRGASLSLSHTRSSSALPRRHCETLMTSAFVVEWLPSFVGDHITPVLSLQSVACAECSLLVCEWQVVAHGLSHSVTPSVGWQIRATAK